MNLFLFIFFLIYAGLHLYAFLKAESALGFGPIWGVAIALFMLVMLLAPFITHFLEQVEKEFAARISAYVGYTWLGVLFLFSFYAFLLDSYGLALSLGSFSTGRDFSGISLSSASLFYIALLLSLTTALYGYFEARDIRTSRITIQTSRISHDAGRLRIVQISDVHLGLIVRENRLQRILAIVKAAQPDIVVSTGDLVDGQVCRLNGLAELLREVTPKYGKYAITGNHEFYAGFEQAKCFTEDAGFTLLRDAAVAAGPIMIAGVDDPAAEIFGLSKKISEKDLLSKLPKEKFTLFLKHRPIAERNSEPFFDLQLSGHVHGGQIFPFTLATRLYYRLGMGFAKVSNRASVYVSRGSGTWGPPIRFLAPPEVTVIDLVRRDLI